MPHGAAAGREKKEVLKVSTQVEKRSFTLMPPALSAMWDGEAMEGFFEQELLLALAALQVVLGPWEPSGSEEKRTLMVARGVQVVLPRRGRVSRYLAAIWAQLVAGLVGYGKQASGAWGFYRKGSTGRWEAWQPLESGKLEPGELQQAAWLASKLKVGKRVAPEAFSLNGQAYKAVSREGWESLEAYEPEGEPLVAVEEPEDGAARRHLLAEAWGYNETRFMAMVAFYLASPLAPTRFFLLADGGGTGKSSFEAAFEEAFPSLTTRGLDAANLRMGGFTGGAALVPLVGKKVAFADEAGALGDSELQAIAGLTTGAVRQVRYGGGRIGLERFSLKLLFSSNQASSFSQLEAVGRRKVEVPELGFKPASWWRGPAGEQWPGKSRWEVCFSVETVCALVAYGWLLWQKQKGEWPKAQAGASLRKVSAELAEALEEAGLLEKQPERGAWPVLYSAFPAVAGTPREKKALRREAAVVAGLGVRKTTVNGEQGRFLAVLEPVKWAAVKANLLEEERKAEAAVAPEDEERW